MFELRALSVFASITCVGLLNALQAIVSSLGLFSMESVLTCKKNRLGRKNELHKAEKIRRDAKKYKQLSRFGRFPASSETLCSEHGHRSAA